MDQTTAHRIGNNSRMETGDCRALLRGIANESVHLIFTSPPYHQIKDYGDNLHPQDLGKPQPYPEYLKTMAEIWRHAHRTLHPGGKLIFNAANIKYRDERKGPTLRLLNNDLIQAAEDAGFILYDEIIWLKKMSYTAGRPMFGSYPYPGNPKMLNQLWENIQILRKPGKRPLPSPEQKEASRLPWSYWQEWTHGVWRIESLADPEHPATFNPELAEHIIRLYSFAGDTVLDPFAGTGTTVLAAERLGRRGIGFELHDKYARVAVRRALSLTQLPLPMMPDEQPAPPKPPSTMPLI